VKKNEQTVLAPGLEVIIMLKTKNKIKLDSYDLCMMTTWLSYVNECLLEYACMCDASD